MTTNYLLPHFLLESYTDNDILEYKRQCEFERAHNQPKNTRLVKSLKLGQVVYQQELEQALRFN